MRTVISSTIALAALPLVYSHGLVTTPPSRQAGDAMKAACGEQLFNQQKSDNAGNVQGELQVAASQKDYNPAACNVFLCKGFQFADNTANVQKFTAGQVVPITVDIRAPHTGVANVSIVDTKANAIIGTPLLTFTDYASNAHTIPATDKQFSITVPDMGSKCATAGDCVVQWWWDAPDIKQTYESCIDFTMGAAPAKRAEMEKRQDMISMTNGPTTTMTFSAVPKSSGESKSEKKSAEPPVTTGTASAAKASNTKSAVTSAATSAMPSGMNMSAASSTNAGPLLAGALTLLVALRIL